MKKIILVIGIVLCMVISNFQFTNSAYAETYSNELQYADAPADNPLIGFASWGAIKNDFPHSLEYYPIPLNKVQNGYNSFDWSIVEQYLNTCKSNGNQAVIRFYLDNPGDETGIPEFLINDSLKVYDYELDGEKGLCPDYSDKNLETALVKFIQAFGQKYDGDPRIGFVEAGLLGFWGEWHTYPYTQWYPTKEIYKVIGTAYAESFKNTYVMIGEPLEIGAYLNIGYHDDMFAIDTNEYFNKLKSYQLENRWLNNPVGTELAPYIQKKYFTEAIEEALDWKESVQLIHPSWCLNAAIKDYKDSDKEAAISCAKEMGYKFFVNKASVATEGDKINLNIQLSNMGTAPFYYDWNIVLRLEDEYTGSQYDYDTDWKLNSIKQLNTAYIFHKEISDADLSHNRRYKVYMKVINPMNGGKNLRFANKEQHSDGWIELIDFSM